MGPYRYGRRSAAPHTVGNMAEANFARTCETLFRQADTDGSGALDRAEFLALLQSKALNLALTAQELREIQHFADKVSGNVLNCCQTYMCMQRRICCAIGGTGVFFVSD